MLTELKNEYQCHDKEIKEEKLKYGIDSIAPKIVRPHAIDHHYYNNGDL